MRVLVAALLAVGQGNGWVRERRQQLFEPILVDRVNVGTGNDNKIAACNGTSPLQIAALREVLGADQTKLDRKSVVSGKSVSVRLDLVGRRSIKKKKINAYNN